MIDISQNGMTQTQKVNLSTKLSAGNVDIAAGVLRKVVLLEVKEAKGWNFRNDLSSLQGALALVEGKKLPGFVGHDECRDLNGDGFLHAQGAFEGFSIVGNQLIAETFTFFPSALKDPDIIRLIEYASTCPEQCGVSIEGSLLRVYQAADGKEYIAHASDLCAPSDFAAIDAMPIARWVAVGCACFVSTPAATSGLFATLFAKLKAKLSSKKSMTIEPAAPVPVTETNKPAEVAAAAPAADTAPAAVEVALATPAVTPSASEVVPEKVALAVPANIATLATEFAASPVRLAAAVGLLVKDPTLTVVALKAAIEAEEERVALAAKRDAEAVELVALRAHKTTSDAKILELSEAVKLAEKSRDEFRLKFEKIKSSGLLTDVNLGAVGPGATHAYENPWKKGAGYSETKQAEITLSSPELAVALKAQAAAVTALAV
jgi:hypothetical protein